MPPNKEVKEIAPIPSGLVTDGEKLQQGGRYLGPRTDQVAKAMMEQLGQEDVVNSCRRDGQAGVLQLPIYMMADSAPVAPPRRSASLPGCAGLMAKPDGDHQNADHRQLPRRPKRSQYFISTHGARKGLADTALKTANSVI